MLFSRLSSWVHIHIGLLVFLCIVLRHVTGNWLRMLIESAEIQLPTNKDLRAHSYWWKSILEKTAIYDLSCRWWCQRWRELQQIRQKWTFYSTLYQGPLPGDSSIGLFASVNLLKLCAECAHMWVHAHASCIALRRRSMAFSRFSDESWPSKG